MKPLILVGASVRAMAFSAVRVGFSPYAIDLYADRDLTEICPAVKVAEYPQGFVEALEAAPEAPWVYTGGLENYPRLVDQMAAIRPLLGNRGDVLRQVRKPEAVADAAHEVGLAFPAMRADGVESGTWLFKPRRGSGGLGVRWATSEAGQAVSQNSVSYWQRYIEGQSAGAVFVAAGGRANLLGATRQLVGGDFGLSLPFIYAGSIGPWSLCKEEREKLAALGTCLARRFGLVGLFNVDFVRTQEQLWVLEINPRYSASVEVLERVTAINALAQHVAACKHGELVEVKAAGANRFAGKTIVYAACDAVVTPALEELVARWNQAGEAPGIADLPRTGDVLQVGQPVVTVLAEGGSAARVEAELRKRVEAVQEVLIR